MPETPTLDSTGSALVEALIRDGTAAFGQRSLHADEHGLWGVDDYGLDVLIVLSDNLVQADYIRGVSWVQQSISEQDLRWADID